MSLFKTKLLQNAARLRDLQNCIHETFSAKPHGPEHKKACEEFHRNYAKLAFPDIDAEELFRRISGNDASIAEWVIEYLEADPYYFRSGYHKDYFLRHIKHMDLNKKHKSRLENVILMQIEAPGYRRDFKRYATLARDIATDHFRAQVETLCQSTDSKVKKKAQLVRSRIRQKPILTETHIL